MALFGPMIAVLEVFLQVPSLTEESSTIKPETAEEKDLCKLTERMVDPSTPETPMSIADSRS